VEHTTHLTPYFLLFVCLYYILSKIFSHLQLSPVRLSNNQGAREKACSSKRGSGRNKAHFKWMQKLLPERICKTRYIALVIQERYRKCPHRFRI
jgi:hypothetical protein